MRLIGLFFVFFLILYGNNIKELDTKIKQNKQIITSVKQQKVSINKTLQILADQIAKEMLAYNNILKILEQTSNQIFLNKVKLVNAQKKVEQLKAKSIRLQKLKKQIEKNVIEFVIERYAMSMGIEQANKQTITDVINKEVYTLVFENAKEQILELNISYLKLNNQIRNNEKQIDKLNQYIAQQNEIKSRYKELKKVQEKALASLKTKHKLYQQSLKQVLAKQNKISSLLSNLKILKRKAIKEEKRRQQRLKEEKRRKAQAIARANRAKQIKINNSVANIDLDVKKLGSSTKGIKISKYDGYRTIPPLKNYTVVKRFGKYYDKVYKMELFNESVTLKTKIPNAKVYSVFSGQVVYAKTNSGLLGNVVIVKHKKSLHTIYSHLDKISPTIKVGKWIPKGYVVGRVNDTLDFQATKNSKYIDPLKLIR